MSKFKYPPDKRRSEPILVSFRPKEKARVKRLGDNSNRSMSDVVRDIVLAGLPRAVEEAATQRRRHLNDAKGPLRNVVRSEFREEGRYDFLDCGHYRVVEDTGEESTWVPRQRRCLDCDDEGIAT